FGSQTRFALKDLKGDLGLSRTGSLEPDQAVALPGPLRISSVPAPVGSAVQPGTPVAEATSTARRVEADIEPSQAEGGKVGDRASIALPNNRSTPGVVRSIRAAAVDSGSASGSGSNTGSDSGSGSRGGSGSSTAMVAVFIALKHVRALGRIGEAPVQVSIITG